MSLGKIISAVLAVICCIFAPLIFFTQQHDSTIQTIVYKYTVDFVEDMREQGKLTQDMYNMFIRDLDATGMLYSIKIECAHETVVPVFNEDGTVKGTKEITEVIYGDDILEKVFTDVVSDEEVSSGVYNFDKGDRITVTVVSREETMSSKLFNSLVSNSGVDEKIYALYGGVIRDENH